MKKPLPILLWILLTTLPFAVKADNSTNIAPVDVGFELEKCRIFDEFRCAKITVSMPNSSYIALGSPRTGLFMYRKSQNISEVSAGSFVYDSKYQEFSVTKTDLKHVDANPEYNYYFNLDEICIGYSCVKTNIPGKSSSGNYNFKTLRFPIPDSMDSIPLKVGFRTIKCRSLEAGRHEPCVQTTISMDRKSFQLLLNPASASYKYHRSRNSPPLSAELVYDSKNDKHFIIKTDYNNDVFPDEHFFFTLYRVCFGNYCLDTDITSRSSSEGFHYKTLYFHTSEKLFTDLLNFFNPNFYIPSGGNGLTFYQYDRLALINRFIFMTSGNGYCPLNMSSCLKCFLFSK